MGAFVQKLSTDYERVEIVNTSALRLCSLFKLKEYQANYQMICESFSINFTEFEQIFGTFSNQNEFYIWDTDTNGLIDYFELFSGLILFADCNMSDKVKYIFDLFDFNHTQSIAFYDMCYLIESCISSTFKMHKLGTAIPSKDLEEYLSGYFFQGDRSKLQDLTNFLLRSIEVKHFLTLFKLSPLTQSSLQHSPNFTMEFKIHKDLYNDFKTISTLPPNETDVYYLNAYEPSTLINNQRFDKYRNILQNSTKRLIYHRTLEKPQIYNNNTIDYNLQLKWVYGIRIHDIKKPCQYANSGDYSLSTGEMNAYEKTIAKHSILIYSIAKVVVLLYVSFNKQKFYTAHTNEVISIAVSKKNNNYIASGELAGRPAIHIWNMNSRETIVVIKGQHVNGVHLLMFAYDDTYLISCGKKETSPVLVYNWKDKIVVYSFMMNYIVQDINEIHFDIDDDEVSSSSTVSVDGTNNNNNNNNKSGSGLLYKEYINNFILCSLKEISIVQIKPKAVNVYHVDIPNDMLGKDMITLLAVKGDIGVNMEINNQLLMMSNSLKTQVFHIIIGYANGEVNLFSVDGFIRK